MDLRLVVACGNETLGELAGAEGAASVDFPDILSRERAASDGDRGSVVVHDEFFSREAVVATRAAHHEVAAAVEVKVAW
jgi:hypothetical protein